MPACQRHEPGAVPEPAQLRGTAHTATGGHLTRPPAKRRALASGPGRQVGRHDAGQGRRRWVAPSRAEETPGAGLRRLARTKVGEGAWTGARRRGGTVHEYSYFL